MTKVMKTILGIVAGCLILGIVLSLAGLLLGGRPTGFHLWWDDGPHISFAQNAAGNNVANNAAGNGSVNGNGNGNGNGNAYAQTPQAVSANSTPAAGSTATPATSPATGTTPAQTGTTTIPTDNVRELSIEISSAAVVLQTGDRYDLQVTGDPNYRARVINGKWEIETVNGWYLDAWQDVTFVITVPQDVTFDEVDLSIGAGTLETGAISCRKADLEVGAGSMNVGSLTCTTECDLSVGMGKLTINGGSLDRKIDISCGMGEVNVTTARPADYGFELEGGMGSVTIGDYTHSGMAVEQVVNRGAATFYEIECGAGTVAVTFA